MKNLPPKVTFYAGITSLLLTVASVGHSQTLTHRYSFNDPTTVIDSVGGANWNGTLLGSATLDGSNLQLDGGGWVILPSGIIDELPAGLRRVSGSPTALIIQFGRAPLLLVIRIMAVSTPG